MRSVTVQLLSVAAISCTAPQHALATPDSAPPGLVGKWRAVDVSSGVVSTIELFVRGNRMFGRITALQDKDRNPIDPICTACKGELENAKVVGAIFIHNLRREENKWISGTVVDMRPGLFQGVVANCEMELIDGRARIRGYVLGGLFSGVHYWDRSN